MWGSGWWLGRTRTSRDSRTELVESSFSASSVGSSPVVSVRAVVLGKVRDVLTNAGSTGELLSAMGINADADDRVTPSPSTPLHSGATVAYDQVQVTTELEDERSRSTSTPGSPRAWCRGT